jgi:alkaline phosphatase
MWAVVATIFVYRDIYQECESRLIDDGNDVDQLSSLSYIPCDLPFHPWDIAALKPLNVSLVVHNPQTNLSQRLHASDLSVIKVNIASTTFYSSAQHLKVDRVRKLSKCGPPVNLGSGQRRDSMAIHSKLTTLIFTLTLSASSLAQAAKAKNVIIFMGDGTGISSLNAASIYGYNRPQSLYIQSFPGVALSDTSTATQWVTDGGAGATAIATGVKTNNGVLSQSSSAVRDQQDGETLKTFFEYAREHGLSTGAVSNEDRQGVTNALTAAFFAHNNNRGKSGEIFEEMLAPKSGLPGLDVAISPGRSDVFKQVKAMGHDPLADMKSHGYTFADSLDGLKKIDPNRMKVVMMTDDVKMDLKTGVDDAVARLSRNPKGFVLVVYSDCHTGKASTSLSRIVELDNIVRELAVAQKQDTLLLWTADHSYDLRIKGEGLTETLKKNEGKKITAAVSLEDEHTAEEVPVMAVGPGSERVHGFISNTDVFHILMQAPGWEQANTIAAGGAQ